MGKAYHAKAHNNQKRTYRVLLHRKVDEDIKTRYFERFEQAIVCYTAEVMKQSWALGEYMRIELDILGDDFYWHTALRTDSWFILNENNTPAVLDQPKQRSKRLKKAEEDTSKPDPRIEFYKLMEEQEVNEVKKAGKKC